MRYPQVLVFESDGRLAETLRRESRGKHWLLREPRTPASCLRLLQKGGPAVLVLKIGKDLIREVSLLERAAWLAPDAACIVVGDSENPALSNLAWDLGATMVLFPPLPRQALAELIAMYLSPPTQVGKQLETGT
jgi:hypothetical protein